jgi:hypothetical protein
MADRIDYVTPEVRLAYLNLFEAKPYMVNGKAKGDPKFSLMMIFEPGKDFDDFKAQAVKAVRARWSDVKLANVVWPFKDGDKEADRLIRKGKTEAQVGFMRGHFLAKAATKYQPEVFDIARKLVTDPKRAFSGTYGWVAGVFNTYETDNAEPAISLYFDKVMLSDRKAERLAGGGRSAADAFSGVRGGTSNENPMDEYDDEIPF